MLNITNKIAINAYITTKVNESSLLINDIPEINLPAVITYIAHTYTVKQILETNALENDKL